MIYDDGSTIDNCMCDGTDDAMYTCDYHRDNPGDEYATAFDAMFPARELLYDLVDAYGAGHYKTGVYDV